MPQPTRSRALFGDLAGLRGVSYLFVMTHSSKIETKQFFTRDGGRHGGVYKSHAFTLIELLIVLAIIALLAGLAFPALQGALDRGKRAQVRNDVTQLAAAVKAFQLEYGRLPSSVAGMSDVLNADNATVVSALRGADPNLNPRGIVFFEAKAAKSGKGGLDGTIYRDPWGDPYTFMLDTSYDNRINAFGRTNLTTVIVSSPGGGAPGSTNNRISNVD